ncbi:MAG: acyl-CoA dehydratase activase [Thermodesulfobacteriota bacterium]
MICCGIDVGSLTGEAVLMDGQSLLGYSIVRTSHDSAETAREALAHALERCSLTQECIGYTVATGYGRVVVPFAQRNVSEISCHARGANYLFPQVRTILDMGGQDCKAIRCDARGGLVSFLMNDKCAAGTGRAVEVMAKLLGVGLEEAADLSLAYRDELPRISDTCVLFAKGEVLSLMREGVPVGALLAAVFDGIAERACLLLRRLGLEEGFVITGGIAKNLGVVRRIEERLGLKALRPPEPQIVGALGAALFALELSSRARPQ